MQGLGSVCVSWLNKEERISGPEREGKDIQRKSEEEGRWEGKTAGVFKKKDSQQVWPVEHTQTAREWMEEGR